MKIIIHEGLNMQSKDQKGSNHFRVFTFQSHLVDDYKAANCNRMCVILMLRQQRNKRPTAVGPSVEHAVSLHAGPVLNEVTQCNSILRNIKRQVKSLEERKKKRKTCDASELEI